MSIVDEICSSNLSYEKKIEKLKKLKEETERQVRNANQLLNQMNFSNGYLNNGRYLSDMKFRQNKIKDRLKWKVPVSTGLTLGLSYPSIDYIYNLINSQNVDSSFVSVACTIVWTLTILGLDPSTIKDIIDYKKYDYEISSYQKRLK